MPDINFATPAGPIAVRGLTPDLLDTFRAQAPDWPEADPGDAIGHVAIADEAGGRRFTSSSYDTPDFVFAPGLGAGNGLIGCLIHSFIANAPDWIALHAGAIETDGGLTVLAGDMMAGKSTMTMALAALGHRVWCDDRLPVHTIPDGFEGMSLALRPKLRWPLPPNAADTFRRFVGARLGATESDMRYLNLATAECAPFDARLPVCRLVILERDAAHGPPAFEKLSLGQTVKELAGCTFGPHLGPVGLLERLRALAEGSEHHVLRYADTFEAAAFCHETWRTR